MDINKLKGQIPDKILAELPQAIKQFGIDSPLRLSHFLSQTSHECANFTKFEENLNYSAQGLANTWPSRYAIDPKAKVKVPNDLAKKLEHKPIEIANTTYAGRFGNGDIKSGDGYKFRGRGGIMVTFHDNYKAFNQFLPKGVDLIKNPDLVSTTYPLLSAAWFFKRNNLNSESDKGATLAVVTSITEKVNGGQIGLNERFALFNKFYNILK
jgi:putative chitinase